MYAQDRLGTKNTTEPTAAEIRGEKARKSKAMLKKIHGLEEDPHFVVNASGKYECNLCHTVHTTVQSFVMHRYGKKHGENVKRKHKILSLRASDIRIRSLLKEGLKGFSLQISLEKGRRWPSYCFVESPGEGIVYVEADPYRTVGFRYKGSVLCDYLSEYFDPKEKVYILQFFLKTDRGPNNE